MDKDEKVSALLNDVQIAKDKALALKQDDSLQSADARRVAVVFTDLEKVEAYIQTFLFSED